MPHDISREGSFCIRIYVDFYLRIGLWGYREAPDFFPRIE